MPVHHIGSRNKEINFLSYKQFCSDNKLQCEKAVFIFPGNATHHTTNHTLFSIKTGEGLAKVANEIGRAGYPTLSLPTTDMEQWSDDEVQQRTANKAIADLYRAVGAGYDLVLPVREHENDNYFDNGLVQSQDEFEPKFWDEVQRNFNKTLAEYYIDCLNELELFANTSVDQRDPLEKNLPPSFYNAYRDGQNMSPNSPWLRKESNFNMQVIAGFISVLGVAAVAVAFVALNAATFGVPGLILAGVGGALIIGGVGLFASSTSKAATVNPSSGPSII